MRALSGVPEPALSSGSGSYPGTHCRMEGPLTGAVAPDPLAQVSRWTQGTSAHGSGPQTRQPPVSCQRRRQPSRGCCRWRQMKGSGSSGEHCPSQEAVGLPGFLGLHLPRSCVTCRLVATCGCYVISLPLCPPLSCGSLLPAPGASVCPPGWGPCRHSSLGQNPRNPPPPLRGEIPVL